jgi:hypothetical protein
MSEEIARPERIETETERIERNWAELLQELRVTQTGVQILTGFLLTLAFQQRFTELDGFQVGLYLFLVSGSAFTTILGLAPVSLHRRLFRQGAKARIVMIANRILRFALLSLAIVLVGTIFFVFDVVAGRTAGIIAAGVAAVVVFAVWALLPRRR